MLKVKVAKTKQGVYKDFYDRVGQKGGRSRSVQIGKADKSTWKDVQLVSLITGRNGDLLTCSSAVMERRKENFVELMNEENVRQHRGGEVLVEQEKLQRLVRMKGGKR